MKSTIAPPPPPITWDSVRQSIQTVRAHGQAYLVGQVWIGWQLSQLKDAHIKAGGGHGGDRRSSGHDVHLKSWAELVEAETGLQRRTADRLIDLFDAAKAKLKRVQSALVANATLIAFERQSPLEIIHSEDEASELRDVILSLVEGETQKSLLHELKVTPEPKLPPVSPGGSKARGITEPGEDEQLAFKFWLNWGERVCEARHTGGELLNLLPVESSDPDKPSLRALREETAALLHDIDETIAAKSKPARGRLITA